MSFLRVILLIFITVSLPWMFSYSQDKFLLRCDQNSKVYGPYEFVENKTIINKDFCLFSIKENTFKVNGFVRGIKRIWGPFTFTNGMIISVADVPLEIITGESFEMENDLRIKKENAYNLECLKKGMERFEGQWATAEQIANIKKGRLEAHKKQQEAREKFISEQKIAQQIADETRKQQEESSSDESAIQKAKTFIQQQIDRGRLLDAVYLGTTPYLFKSFMGEDHNMFSKRLVVKFNFKYRTESGFERWNEGPVDMAYTPQGKKWCIMGFTESNITGVPYMETNEGKKAFRDAIDNAFKRRF